MLIKVFKDALSAPYGLALQTRSHYSAQQLRRKLYAYRERLRQQGVMEYDCLSFIAKANGELWIVRRNIAHTQNVQELPSRPLSREELPSRILARGKRKSGLLSMILNRMEKKP